MDLIARKVGQPLIDQHGVGPLFHRFGQRFGAAGSFFDSVIQTLQSLPENDPDIGLIVDNEDEGFGAFRHSVAAV
jgi:hypothetical protein